MEAGSMRALRQQLKMSQGDLAEELNRRVGRSYDRPKVSRWENGKEMIPEDVASQIQAMISSQPRRAQIIVLANQKGGVGKTTSALNLALAFTREGSRVLFIDFDPQATATVALFGQGGVELYHSHRTMAHVVLREGKLSDAVVRAGETVAGRFCPFDFAASHIDLAEIDSHREPGFDSALREELRGFRKTYDFILIDAPPNLGMLTWMALAASDTVIVPVQCEPYDSMGVGLILGTARKVKRRLNPNLRVAGVLPTRFSARQSADRRVLEHLLGALANVAPVLEPVPDNSIYGNAAIEGRIALAASPTHKAVQAYVRMAEALSKGTSLPLANLETSLTVDPEPNPIQPDAAPAFSEA